jgi:hypothetical protein
LAWILEVGHGNPYLRARRISRSRSGVDRACVVLVHRGVLPVIVAGVVGAVVSETIAALAADGYAWGAVVRA